MDADTQPTSTSIPDHLVRFPSTDGSRVPFDVYRSQEIYDREQDRIFRGPTWSFLALEAEIPNPGDFKSTFVGDTPVVVARTEDNELAAWVNRCAHRGAMVCRAARGNAMSHICVYHQWTYSTRGALQGVPFRRGQKEMVGMPADFDPKAHSLRPLRVEGYRGLVFATFSDTAAPVCDYIGEQMRPWIDRIFHKPIVYLGCTRQYSKSNWKLYTENIKDPYHASLLHLFHTTFNILRVGMKARAIPDATHGLHSVLTVTKNEEANTAEYREQRIRSFNQGFRLEDPSLLDHVQEYDELTTWLRRRYAGVESVAHQAGQLGRLRRLYFDGRHRGHRARAARDPPARQNGIVNPDGPRSSRAAGQPDHRKPDPQVLDRLSAFDGPLRMRWKTYSCGSRFFGSKTAT